MLTGEAANTNVIVFGLARQGAESTIYCNLAEHANPYTTDVNAEAWGAESTIYCTLAEHANPYTTDAVQTNHTNTIISLHDITTK